MGNMFLQFSDLRENPKENRKSLIKKLLESSWYWVFCNVEQTDPDLLVREVCTFVAP